MIDLSSKLYLSQQQFNLSRLTFDSPEKKQQAIDNIINSTLRTAAHNELYDLHLRNFKISTYWFDYLSDAEFAKEFFGSEPQKEEVKTIEPITFSNGTVIQDIPVTRGKRQTSSFLPFECKNLPAYKNWVEEGKTSPVQNQLGCGKFRTWKLILTLVVTLTLN